MQTLVTLWSRFALVILAVTFAAAPAGAQEPAQAGQVDPGAPGEPEADEKPAPPPDSGIEEIVVLGAESEAARDFEAADSVTGFGADDLAALGAQDIADLADFTPNLEIVTSGATTPTFFIRGVGLNDFNANATGAVAIYRDDVMINAPALQLQSLFDVEAVNILRGPQGTGLARNASAGAIKMYSRKPTGELGGFLRSELGNFDFRDFEGALEAPIYEDLLAGRFAFRFSERAGTMKNRCAGAPPAIVDPTGENGRVPVPPTAGPPGRVTLRSLGKTSTDPPWSICGERVLFSGIGADPSTWSGISQVPVGLPSRVNDIGNWAARGTLLFQPTLDMSLLLNAHGSRRDELSRLGQAYGTSGSFIGPDGRTVAGLLGGTDSDDYQTQEVRQRLVELAPCLEGVPNRPQGICQLTPEGRALENAAKIQVAQELAQDPLDSEPWEGDFNFCSARSDTDGDPSTFNYRCRDDGGRTQNDTWGTYLKADVVLPWGMQLNSLTAYDTYDRLIDSDLDFSSSTLFQIRTEDEGWQVAQDLRLQGQLGDDFPVRWDVGAWFLREQLDVTVVNDLGNVTALGVGRREYTQDLWSAAGYLSLGFDFWERFTLDGGFRYNWEHKKLDYLLETIQLFPVKLTDTWSAPTGTVRLTYRFREDTHVFWKYTRGWKSGTYNATSNVLQDFETGLQFANVSVADPEVIDAFETGLRGSWLEGRLGLDLSVFYYDYKDYQLFIAQQFAIAGTGAPEFVILNAEGAEVYGAELDLVARPWLGAFANVRFGWLESQFLDFVQIQQQLLPGNRTLNREIQNTGNRLLNSPRFKLSLTAEQTLPLGRWGSLTARYDGVWTDTTFYDATEGRGIPNGADIEFMPEDTIAQPAFWLHNLRLSYRLPGGQVEVAGWVRNLTNEPYKTFAFDGSTFSQTTIYFVGDPRTFGGTLVVNF